MGGQGGNFRAQGRARLACAFNPTWCLASLIASFLGWQLREPDSGLDNTHQLDANRARGAPRSGVLAAARHCRTVPTAGRPIAVRMQGPPSLEPTEPCRLNDSNWKLASWPSRPSARYWATRWWTWRRLPLKTRLAALAAPPVKAPDAAQVLKQVSRAMCDVATDGRIGADPSSRRTSPTGRNQPYQVAPPNGSRQFSAAPRPLQYPAG
jgi:hypothetical protein